MQGVHSETCRTKTILGVIIFDYMKSNGVKDTTESGVCSNENKNKKEKKKRCWEDRGYKDPPFYDEFRPFWGPGSKYKPWIYGK